MKLYRFISENEKTRLLNGETIANNRDWSKYYDTNSVGICFFAYNKTNDLRKVVSTVLENWGFAGIVSSDYIVEIEIDTARKAWGWYSDGKHTEYNLNTYTINSVKSIHKVSKLDATNWIVREDYFYTYGVTKIF